MLDRAIRLKIVEAARHVIGTPWRHQGRSPGYGLDCVGLIRYAGISAGLIHPEDDYITYNRTPHPLRMGAALAKYFEKVPRRQPVAGDILWLTLSSIPMHVAIYTEDDTIIHASGPAGHVIEHGYRYPWPGRLRGIFEYKDTVNV